MVLCKEYPNAYSKKVIGMRLSGATLGRWVAHEKGDTYWGVVLISTRLGLYQGSQTRRSGVLYDRVSSLDRRR